MTKLWLVKPTVRIWDDEYASMVVAAGTEEEALTYHPSGYVKAVMVEGYWKLFWHNPGSSLHGEPYQGPWNYCSGGWSDPNTLVIEYLGTTDRDIKGVVLASYNVG
jgi:hypothetical protein